MNQNRKILILYLTGIGNTILFLPTLRVLRQQLPNTIIDVVVRHDASREIIERVNTIRRIYVFNPDSYATLVKKYQFIKTLRQEEYDVSLTTFPSNRAAFNILSYLIGAKRRIAPGYQVGHIETCGFLQNELVHTHVNCHDVKQNLSLLTALELDVSLVQEDISWNIAEEETHYAERVLRESGLASDDLLIGFHPGCNPGQGNLYKRWPTTYFAALADKLIEQFGAKILIFGSTAETSLKKDIFNGMQHKPIIPETTSLSNTAALIKTCRLFVSNDSGLMHTAAAMGVQTVSLFGPSDPTRNAPHGRGHIVVRANPLLPCMPCNKYPHYQYGGSYVRCIHKNAHTGFCMQSIPVERVYKMIVKNYSEILPVKDGTQITEKYCSQ